VLELHAIIQDQTKSERTPIGCDIAILSSARQSIGALSFLCREVCGPSESE
jgi:hypothetical protein